MITNWEIVSRFDKRTKSQLFTLVCDGTEQDARLIAKKLQGYVKLPMPAEAPYVYAFELPCDLNEDTVEKIRIAMSEGVEQTNKINQFVPGGILGDPLYSNEVGHDDKDFPTFITLDPSESFFRAPDGPTNSNRGEISLDEPAAVIAQTQAQQPLPGELNVSQHIVQTNATPQVPPEDKPAHTQPPTPPMQAQEPADPAQADTLSAPVPQPIAQALQQTQAPLRATQEISINDNDMLIKDMEGTVLDKMPLQDIFSAETKYDMFIQTDQTPGDPTPQQARDKKMADLTDGDNTPAEPFNAFEQKMKDTTSMPDLEDLNSVADNLTKKDLDFVQHAPEAPAAPQAKPGALPEEETLGTTTRSLHVIPGSGVADENPEQLPEITVRQKLPGELTKTFHLTETIDKKTIKSQYKKSFHNPADTPAKQATVPPAPHTQTPGTHTILRLKKRAQAPQPAAPQIKEAAMPQEAQEEVLQTSFRLRRKAQPNAPAPAQPVANQPAQPAPKAPAADTPSEKTKTIDHSIELPVSELKKHNWPLEVPLLPTYTLENMVMSVNRFAHATAISVIDNPGKLYNPLVLHGATGTGKTHFLNAMAYALSKKFGQENIFMTNGVRFSRGIQRYVMEGNIEKFNTFMDSVKVLLIDDIHLLAINEQNRRQISALLNKFLKEQKQIIITSKYPPESLEKLEELIQFRLDSGWISELKPASGSTHIRIVKKMLGENGVDLNDKQIDTFFGGSHMTLSTITRSIRRLKVLENLIFPHIPEEKRSQADIFEKLLATQGEDPSSAILKTNMDDLPPITPAGNGEWGRIGFFYPQNSSHMMNWMVYALQQRAKELGIPGGFEIAVRSSYATENIISSAFKIANLCDNKKLKGAIILGPSLATCEPSVRENFYDILTHMLEIMLIRCGIINMEHVTLPSTYVKVISELWR